MSEAKVKKGNPLVDYLQDSFQELKKVTWPTRNQAVRLTLLVLGFCVAAAVVIGLMDGIFSFGHQKLVDYATTVNPPEYVEPVTTTAPASAKQPVVNVGNEQPATAATTVTPITAATAPVATATTTTQQ